MDKWVKVGRLGAINYAKFGLFNSAFSAGLQLLTLNIIGAFLILVASTIGALLTAAIMNFCFGLGFINGLDLRVWMPDEFATKVNQPDGWVKVRAQGALNTGKICGLFAFIIGVPIGLAVSVFLAFGTTLISAFYSPAASWITPFAFGALVIVPLGLGLIGFVFGAFWAGSGNWVRGFTFINGLDVKITPPKTFSNNAGENTAWIKVVRFGCINLAKINGVQDLIFGVLALAVGLLFAGAIAAALPTYANQIAQINAIGLLVGILVIGLIVAYGALSGLVIGVVANWALSQPYVNGLDLQVSWRNDSKVPVKPIVLGASAA